MSAAALSNRFRGAWIGVSVMALPGVLDPPQGGKTGSNARRLPSPQACSRRFSARGLRSPAMACAVSGQIGKGPYPAAYASTPVCFTHAARIVRANFFGCQCIQSAGEPELIRHHPCSEAPLRGRFRRVLAMG